MSDDIAFYSSQRTIILFIISSRCYFLGTFYMTKEKLVEKVNDLLRTDADLNFLLALKKEEIERLVACIRDRLDQVGK